MTTLWSHRPRPKIRDIASRLLCLSSVPKIDMSAFFPKIDMSALFPKPPVVPVFVPKIDTSAFFPKIDMSALFPKPIDVSVSSRRSTCPRSSRKLTYQYCLLATIRHFCFPR